MIIGTLGAMLRIEPDLTRNMVELRVTLAVEITREFGSEDPSHAAIGVS